MKESLLEAKLVAECKRQGRYCRNALNRLDDQATRGIKEKLRGRTVMEPSLHTFLQDNVAILDYIKSLEPEPRTVKESQLEAKLVGECKRRGLYCRKFSSPAHAGVPDRIVCGHGKVLFLELKSAGNRPTALQARELEILRNLGMVAAWTDSFEGVLSLLNNQWP